MIQHKNYLVSFLVLSSLVLNISPCWAGSKTATIQVSCTILPSIQMSSSPSSQSFSSVSSSGYLEEPALPAPRPELALSHDNELIHVNTNLGNNYSVAETLLANGGKLYSVTAL